MINRLPIEKWLELNAKLQQKKNTLRAALNEKGVMKKDKENGFDHYNYFSEAGYKKLFTELFPKAGLDLNFTELTYDSYQGTEKQPNGRQVHMLFTLNDTETGFYEQTEVTAEALDKGDKAGYKAYTGAIKYYLANTFMVATGDDPENESPEGKADAKKQSNVKARQQSSQQSKASEQAAAKKPAERPVLSQEAKETLDSFSEEVKTWMVRAFKHQTIEEITEPEINEVVKMMKEKEAMRNGN